MNWLFLVILLLIVFFAVHGGFQGLLRVLFSLVSIILLVVLVAFATPHISTFLKNNTSLYAGIEKRTVQRVEDYLDSAGTENSSDGEKADKNDSAGSEKTENIWNFPEPVQKYVNELAKKEGLQSGLSTDNQDVGNAQIRQAGTQIKDRVAKTVGSRIADVILSVISFLIALAVVLILLAVISHALGLVNRIPVLGGINRFLGVFAGAFQGIILAWVILLILTLSAGTQAGSTISAMISENTFLTWLNDHNGVLYVLQMILTRQA